MKHHVDSHFKLFAGQLERAIEKYGGVDEIVLVERQKKRFIKLTNYNKPKKKMIVTPSME